MCFICLPGGPDGYFQKGRSIDVYKRQGLELECKRYALRPIRFSWPEVLVSLLGVVFLAALLFLDQTRIGEIILWRV